MGSALEDYRFTDSYGRIWMVCTWLTEYNDTKMVTFSLPVPGGCIVMMRTDQTGNIDQGHIPDLKVFSDFIYVSYYGTFKDWREFLGMKDLLPSTFSTLDIHIRNNEVFRYQSKRLSLSYGPDILKISDYSDLRLDFGYFQDQGKTVWDITNIAIGEERYNQTGYTVSRKMKPPRELGDQYQSNWEDMVEQKFPYNRSAYYKDKVTIISTTHHQGSKSERGDIPFVSSLYTVAFIGQGNVGQKEMDAKLEAFMRNLVVYENTEDNANRTGNPQPKN